MPRSLCVGVHLNTPKVCHALLGLPGPSCETKPDLAIPGPLAHNFPLFLEFKNSSKSVNLQSLRTTMEIAAIATTTADERRTPVNAERLLVGPTTRVGAEVVARRELLRLPGLLLALRDVVPRRAPLRCLKGSPWPARRFHEPSGCGARRGRSPIQRGRRAHAWRTRAGGPTSRRARARAAPPRRRDGARVTPACAGRGGRAGGRGGWGKRATGACGRRGHAWRTHGFMVARERGRAAARRAPAHDADTVAWNAFEEEFLSRATRRRT